MSSYAFFTRCGSDTQKIVDYTALNNNDSCIALDYPMCYILDTDACLTGYKDVRCGEQTICCPEKGLSQNYINWECNNGKCNIDIKYENRQLKCSSSASLIDCLNDPEITYINDKVQKATVPWLISPSEIYKTLRYINSPCGNETDNQCLPYTNLYTTNDESKTDNTCLSGKYNYYDITTNLTTCDDAAVHPACTVLSWTDKSTQDFWSPDIKLYSVRDFMGGFFRNERQTTVTHTPALSCPIGKKRRSECDKKLAHTWFDNDRNVDSGIVTASITTDITCCDSDLSNIVDPMTAVFKFTGTNNTNKKELCDLFCPLNEHQDNCDYDYYTICNKLDCTLDDKCKTNWLSGSKNGKLLPNRLPTVISLKSHDTHTIAPI